MVSDRKKEMKGSPARDAWKHWHKSLSGSLYGTDIDFAFVGKYPPGIVAIVDYKQPWDRISFSEVLAYNDFLRWGKPVYIVEGRYMPDAWPPFEKFTIRQYLGGDYKPDPPTVRLRVVLENITLKQYEQWEKQIRS